MLTWTIRCLAAAVALVTLLPVVRRDAWWIRAAEFPRPQVLAAALVGLVAAPLGEASAPAAAVVALVCAAAALEQARRVLPFTRLWRRPRATAVAEGGAALSVLVANVLMTNRRADSLLALVRRLEPDLVLAIETDGWWQRALEPLRASHPYLVERPQDDTYGMLLFSRYPLAAAEVRFLVWDDVPSLRCRLEPSAGEAVTFYGLHPKPPAPREATETSPRDAELLLVAREVAEAGGPVIVAGDMNDVPWSRTTGLFRRVSGLLDPRRGRGLLATFPARRPLLRFPLDHVFHSASVGLVELRRAALPGSDHLALFARLRTGAAPASTATEPPAEGEDRERARRRIATGLAAAD